MATKEQPVGSSAKQGEHRRDQQPDSDEAHSERQDSHVDQQTMAPAPTPQPQPKPPSSRTLAKRAKRQKQKKSKAAAQNASMSSAQEPTTSASQQSTSNTTSAALPSTTPNPKSISFFTGAQQTVQVQTTTPIQKRTSRIDMEALEVAMDRMWAEAKASCEAREAATPPAPKQTTIPVQQSTSNAASTALPSAPNPMAKKGAITHAWLASVPSPNVMAVFSKVPDKIQDVQRPMLEAWLRRRQEPEFMPNKELEGVFQMTWLMEKVATKPGPAGILKAMAEVHFPGFR